MRIVHTETFRKGIWRIIAGSTDSMGIESRDGEQLSVDFHQFNLNRLTCHLISEHQQTWWSTLIHIARTGAYFKAFESQENPFRQKLNFLDFSSRELSGISEEQLPEVSSNYAFPAIYPVASPEYDVVATYLQLHQVVPSGTIEYMEMENVFVVAFNVEGQSGKKRELLVGNPKGELMLKETVYEKVQGEIANSFISYLNLVIFVRNENELVVYET